MSDGNKQTATQVIPKAAIWDDYYECLHIAHYAMREMFAASGLTQEELATRLGISKSLVCKRFNGSENHTLKTLSQMGTGMNHRLVVAFQPYDQVGMCNLYHSTPLHGSTTATTATPATASTTFSTFTHSVGTTPNTFASPIVNIKELAK